MPPRTRATAAGSISTTATLVRRLQPLTCHTVRCPGFGTTHSHLVGAPFGALPAPRVMTGWPVSRAAYAARREWRVSTTEDLWTWTQSETTFYVKPEVPRGAELALATFVGSPGCTGCATLRTSGYFGLLP